jgi:hypothetical protein
MTLLKAYREEIFCKRGFPKPGSQRLLNLAVP